MTNNVPIIGQIIKDITLKDKIVLPEDLHEELEIYTEYIGGNRDKDITITIKKMIEYVLKKEGKKKEYKNFKKDYYYRKNNINENQ